MIGQLEFADTIVLNKLDLITEREDIMKICEILKKINPHAEIVATSRSKVPMNKIINTGRFTMDRAAQMGAWMDRTRYDILPETEEFNITSFIYTATRPFDSKKFHKECLEKLFMPFISPEDPNMVDEEELHNHDHKHEESAEDAEDKEESEDDTIMDEENQDDEEEQGFTREDREKAAAAFNVSPFKNVYRSKGMIWVSSQIDAIFTMQTAGMVNEVKHLGKWLASGT